MDVLPVSRSRSPHRGLLVTASRPSIPRTRVNRGQPWPAVSLVAMGAMKRARLELFKRGGQLRGTLAFLKKASESLGGLRVNLPNKMKGQAQELLDSASLILEELPDADLCLHYSLKNMSSARGTASAALQRWLKEAAERGVQKVLLVSGTGQRPREDSCCCLEQLAEAGTDAAALPSLGVAFSPFEEVKGERERLRRKLKTGLVKEVWLQIGSDLSALQSALQFLRSEGEAAAPGLVVYGSFFLPTEQLLKRMRERPWKGVDLTRNDYLQSVQSARRVTQEILRLYQDYDVIPLVESPVEDLTALHELNALLELNGGRPEQGAGSGQPCEA